MPFPRPTLSQLRQGAMQDVTASDLPNADGFLRRSPLRVLAWVQAGLAYLHYVYLDWVARMSVPFTAAGEFLEAWAGLAPTPVLRTAPQPARGPVTWTGTTGRTIPAGTLCARSDGVQFTVDADTTVDGAGTGNANATVTAVVAGANANTDSGAPITLGLSIAGIDPVGAATGPLTGGDELEQDDPMRTRMLESYAAPPHGGNHDDYRTWALEVSGVTRAWIPQVPFIPGAVTVFFMMDVSEAVHDGFPQGTDGVASAETRDVAATGDQLEVANHLFTKRPVTVLVYAVAPTPQPQAFTIQGLSGTSLAQRQQVTTALTDLLYDKDTPLGDVSINQSDVDGALFAIAGLPSFAVTSPSSWPITSPVGSLFTLGTITYS